MYNSDTPLRAELPTSSQLVRSTVLAAIAAVVLLVAVVLPAEYGIDPTGIGRVLRLTEMGNVKQQLAAEAAADTAAAAPKAKLPATSTVTTPVAPAADTGAAKAATPPVVQSAAADDLKPPAKAVAPKVQWRDETPFKLAPGQGTEIKLVMKQGEKAQYQWVVEGGEVNFDTHGDAFAKSISYEKGRGVSNKEGVLEAAFTGNHGWYWRNRGTADVQVILRTSGEYTEIKK
jgi:hypothetical protein